MKVVSLFANKKSCGEDNVPMIIIKKVIHLIAQPLVHIFNTSFSTNTFPLLFKTSTIVPIHKKGSLTDLNNYRPISLLNNFGKVLEKIVGQRLNHHLESQNLLSEQQFGFRANKSTSDAVSSFLFHLDTMLSSKLHVIGIFCDLKKAFDLVDHSILLSKLSNFSIGDSTQRWFSSYLSMRQQKVKVSDCRGGVVFDTFSSLLPVRAGVPQGSVLGPILFLLYINDLDRCDTSAKFVLFADDTSILVGGNNYKNVVEKTQSTLSIVSSWFMNNKLTLNKDKTSFMYFKSRPIAAQLQISTPLLTIQSVNDLKFLGLYLDAGLHWKAHMTYLKPKLASAIFAIKSIQRNVGASAALLSYHAYFHSLMSYGVIYWGFASGSNDIFLLQKRSVRAIFNLQRTVSCRPLFKRHRILTFAAQVILDSCTLIHKMSHVLPKHSDVHQYDTRHKNNLTTSGNSLFYKSFLSNGIRIYNSLSVELRQKNVNFFKIELKEILLNAVPYKIEDFCD